MTDVKSIVRQYQGHEIPVAGQYAIDAAHTSVEFVARHLMITKVRGRFSDVSGTITIEDEPELSHVEVEVGMASVDTGNGDRDAHLRGADFFDVEKNPTMSFRSSGLRPTKSGKFQLTGELTIAGVSRPVAFDVEFDGATPSPFGDERIAFSAETEINRDDWGLTWNVALETGGFLVSKNAKIEINVQAVKQ